MSRWRFYPLAEIPTAGVLVQAEGDKRHPVAAVFFTPEQARMRAQGGKE